MRAVFIIYFCLFFGSVDAVGLTRLFNQNHEITTVFHSHEHL